MNLCLPYWKSLGIPCGLESGHPACLSHSNCIQAWCIASKTDPFYIIQKCSQIERLRSNDLWCIISISPSLL